MKGAPDSFFVEVHHGIAVGFLIGSVLERVQGERIVVGCGDFLFDQAAEDAGLDGR